MEYDEIRITTRREIGICRDAIRKLENVIRLLEEKYPHAGDVFNDQLNPAAPVPSGDQTRWQDSRLALERWRERLREHLRIMEM
ncbi:MAG: hypothetical protein AB1724_18370 [Thermodesulfobacteriota bacterium]